MKIIKIDNTNKFYKKLFIYKSFLYKKVLFESNNKDIIPIIKALNIKNRKKRIIYIYDYACSYVDNYMKKQNSNPCGFKNCKCIVQRKENSKNINGCCRKCYLNTSKGCSTSNLTCKLFYCNDMKNKYKTLKIKDIKILKLLSFRQRIMINSCYFITRERYIKNLYNGSIILLFISNIKELGKIVKNYHKNKC